MLQADVTGQYQAVSVVFLLMAVLPWVLLTRSGRRRIGVVKPTRWRWMLPGAIAGAGACVVVFALFSMLWAGTMQNAFAYIGSSYSAVPADASVTDRATYFAIFAVIGMTFSPIGEELLYRGGAQECLRRRLGMTRAALVDAAAFAVVHLAHFGVVYTAVGGWAFLPAPASLWVATMFASALVFHAFRVLTGSILGAIASHAGFNLAMTFVIFFVVDVV